MKLFPSLALCAMLCFGAQPLIAAEKDDAAALVEQAAKAVQANSTSGLKDIQDGKFSKGEVYVFAYDMGAVMLAHPKNPRLVGKNLLEQPDAEGKLFRKEIVDKAAKTGSGWVDYVYKNPTTQAVENKTTFFKKVGDVVLCAGAYK